jgi:NifU-like protein involved in Fe-S cluster formation
MNRQRRKQLKEAFNLISEARSIIEEVMDDEQGTIDNMPEGLRGGEQCEGFEANVDVMATSIDALDDAVNEIAEVAGVDY